MYRPLTFCSLFLLGLISGSAQAADAFEVKDNTGQYADIITPDGKPILRYMYSLDTSDDAKKFDTAKVFAHVMADDGETTLTKGAGGNSHTIAEFSSAGTNSSRAARATTFGMFATRFRNTVNSKQPKQPTKAPNSRPRSTGSESMANQCSTKKELTK